MNPVHVLRVVVSSAALLGACPGAAAADWQFAPLVGLTFKGSTTLINLDSAAGHTRWNFGGAVTYTFARLIGVEGLFIYTPGFLDDKERFEVTSGRTLALMGNVVLAMPRQWNEYGLRPFVSGGVGLLQTTMQDARDVFAFKNNLLGLNVGGGATGAITDRMGLRFELRYFSQLGPGAEGEFAFGRAQLRYWTSSVGVSVRR